uniref:ATP synthase F0 subunit 8 n=1 Tax=Acropyga fuhrmanni TaxID=602205 RepID=A0A6G5NIX1_9HYME|nr:ATP synthase F0 subunit 8 [Acropyga fuhrmanni]QBG38608.1 ATP synthase F0 subunit 8 [Acropyga fuhrmanni]
MPHMSPTMWILIMTMTLASTFMITMMLYFLTLPNLNANNHIFYTKWMWKWI